MRRSDLLSLTGLSVDMYNSLARRGQVPWTRDRDSRAGWTAFSVRDALFFSLMLELAGVGLPLVAASALLRTEGEDLWAQARSPRRSDLFFGYASLGTAERVYEPATGKRAVIGDLAACAALIAKLNQPDEPVVHLVLVNATECAKALLARADVAGLKDQVVGGLPAAFRPAS